MGAALALASSKSNPRVQCLILGFSYSASDHFPTRTLQFRQNISQGNRRDRCSRLRGGLGGRSPVLPPGQAPQLARRRSGHQPHPADGRFLRSTRWTGRRWCCGTAKLPPRALLIREADMANLPTGRPASEQRVGGRRRPGGKVTSRKRPTSIFSLRKKSVPARTRSSLSVASATLSSNPTNPELELRL